MWIATSVAVLVVIIATPFVCRALARAIPDEGLSKPTLRPEPLAQPSAYGPGVHYTTDRSYDYEKAVAAQKAAQRKTASGRTYKTSAEPKPKRRAKARTNVTDILKRA